MSRTRLWTGLLSLPPILLATVLFGPVLFAPKGHAPATCDDDFYMYYLPMAEVAFGMWREGTLPLWNPYLYSGMPLLASIEIGVLYPPNWLHLLVDAERAFCLLYVAHIGLAAGGTWWFSRQRGLSCEAALFAVVSFTFAAPIILHHDKGMTSIVYSSTWFPAILAMVDSVMRTRTTTTMCVLALMLACQFLAGFPLFTLCLAWILVGYLSTHAVNWKVPLSQANGMLIMRYMGSATLALGLVAPQLLSTLDYLAQSRRSDLSYVQSTHACLPIPSLLTFLVPGFFGNERNCPYWGEAIFADSVVFCGTTTLLLATMSGLHARRREVLFWLILVISVLGVALGDGSALYDFCFLFVPGVNRFRGVSRLSIFAIFGLAMLAAYGLDALLTSPPGRVRSRFYVGLGSLALIVGVAAAIQSFGSTLPELWFRMFAWVRAPGTELMTQWNDDAIPDLLRQSYQTMLRTVLISSAAVAIACGGLAAVSMRPSLRRATALMLLSLLCVELYVFDHEYVVLMDSTPWKTISRKAEAALPHDREPYRIAGFSYDPPLLPNRFLFGRQHSTGGHENFVLERYSLFVEIMAGIEPGLHTYLTIPNIGPIYDLLNVRYFFAVSDQHVEQPEDELVQERVFEYRGQSYSLYRNGNALPRAFLAHQATSVKDMESAARRLGDLESGSPLTDSVVEGDLSFLSGSSADGILPESATVTDFGPGHVVVDVQCHSPAMLVYVGNYATGWKATVDGRPVPILPTNLWMRALPVPAGAKRVEMIYGPDSFRWGLGIASLALIATFTGLLWPFLRRRMVLKRSD